MKLNGSEYFSAQYACEKNDMETEFCYYNNNINRLADPEKLTLT